MCYSCNKKNSWRMHTDTEEHFYIFGVLMEYMAEHNAKQAYNALKKHGLDFRNTEGFLPSVQKLLAEIYTLSRENSRVKKTAAAAKKTDTEELANDEPVEQKE